MQFLLSKTEQMSTELSSLIMSNAASLHNSVAKIKRNLVFYTKNLEN